MVGASLLRLASSSRFSSRPRLLSARLLPALAVDDETRKGEASLSLRRRAFSSSASASSPLSFLDKEASVAGPGYNRWMIVPASAVVQLSIGSVYAWSIFNAPLTHELGVVVPAASDWALSEVVPIFSACAISLGFTTAGLGPWAERSGPRKVAMAAACFWGGGLGIASLGVMTHTLPLVYLGYGVLGGAGRHDDGHILDAGGGALRDGGGGGRCLRGDGRDALDDHRSWRLRSGGAGTERGL